MDTLQNRGANLECHEQTFTLNIREAQVNTTRVSVRVTIAHDVFHFVVDALDQMVR